MENCRQELNQLMRLERGDALGESGISKCALRETMRVVATCGNALPTNTGGEGTGGRGGGNNRSGGRRLVVALAR